MNRLATLALAGLCLLVAIVPTLAKKKPAKPVIETFEARVPGGEVLRFEIEEFSTDQDIQELAKAYTNGGAESVESALGKVEKGRSWLQSHSYPSEWYGQAHRIGFGRYTSSRSPQTRLPAIWEGTYLLVIAAILSRSLSSESINRAEE